MNKKNKNKNIKSLNQDEKKPQTAGKKPGVSIDPMGLFRQGATFVNEALLELKKMAYPSRMEVVQATIMIFVMVTILSIFLWLLDILFSWTIRGFLGL